MVFDVSLQMQSDSKNYVSVQDDKTELVHTIKSACAWLNLENVIFNELLQKSSFERSFLKVFCPDCVG